MLGLFFITEDRKTRDTVSLSVHRRANVPWRNREMLHQGIYTLSTGHRNRDGLSYVEFVVVTP
jgi:hypothetical protein